MSWRYQKRIRLLPGLHLNLSKSGVGLSIGGRGAHFGWTARGRRYVNLAGAGTQTSGNCGGDGHFDVIGGEDSEGREEGIAGSTWMGFAFTWPISRPVVDAVSSFLP